MTEAQENELADMITDVAIDYANGHAVDFRIAAKAAAMFVTQAQPSVQMLAYVKEADLKLLKDPAISGRGTFLSKIPDGRVALYIEQEPQ